MSFSETRLEVGVPASSGGVSFRTTSTRVGSGFEKRTPGRSEYLYQGDVGKMLLSEKQVAYVIAFFNARKGRAIGFRYKYWADYQVTSEPRSVDPFTTTQGVASLVPGSSNEFQLQKKYTSFGVSSLKTIVKPCVGTVQVFVDGTLQSSGVTIDYTEGKVTIDPAPAPGAIITWSGEFDLPVRFDSDKLPGLMEYLDRKSQETLFRFDSLPIVELANISPSLALPLPPPPPILNCADATLVVTGGKPAVCGIAEFTYTIVSNTLMTGVQTSPDVVGDGMGGSKFEYDTIEIELSDPYNCPGFFSGFTDLTTRFKIMKTTVHDDSCALVGGMSPWTELRSWTF